MLNVVEHVTIMETRCEEMTQAECTVSSDGISVTVEDNIYNYILGHDHMYCESPLAKDGPMTEPSNGTLTPKEEPGNETTDRILDVVLHTQCPEMCDTAEHNRTVTNAKTEDQSNSRIIGSIQALVGETVKSEEESDTCVQMSDAQAQKDDVTSGGSSSTHHLPESRPGESCVGERQRSKVKAHTCVLCGEGFKTWQAVSSHLQLHTASYQSHVNTTATHVLDTHSLTAQGTGADKAAQCSNNRGSDGDSNGRYEHNSQVISSTNKKHRCSCCGKEFRSRSGLRSHERFCMETRPYKCNFCDTRYKQHYELSRHVKNCRQCTCRCPVCDRGFISSYALSRHMLTHTGERPHKCSVCGQSFSQTSNYNCHLRTHTGEKPHVCSVCGQNFTQTGSLWRHMMKFHMVHKCSVCRRGFTELSALQEHILNHGHTTKKSRQGISIHSLLKTTHDKDKLYMCSVCKKLCKTMLDLHHHMQTHKNNQPQPCSTDQKSDKSELSNRKDTGPDQTESVISSGPVEDTNSTAVQGVHTGANTDIVQRASTVHKANRQEEPQQCSVCGKRFTLTATLKKHMMTHTEQYKCGVCSQIFTCLASVTQHIKSHNKKQPYISQTHMNTQTPDKPCKCGVCNKTFREVKFLIRHMRFHSGQKPNVSS